MKDLKLSFPFPSTSRHNLSQDVSTSFSLGLVTPVRIVKVLPGDSHRISTSYSLISNPLVKPLLQGVRMRLCRFWVPSRIYHIDLRANNAGYDPLHQTVRYGSLGSLLYPQMSIEASGSTIVRNYSNYQQSCLFDYLGVASYESNLYSAYNVQQVPSGQQNLSFTGSQMYFNAEPYLAYIDICRNYFADSANGFIAWASRCSSSSGTSDFLDHLGVVVSPLSLVDEYIDGVQNSRGVVFPYNWSSSKEGSAFAPFVLNAGLHQNQAYPVAPNTGFFSRFDFGTSHVGLCVCLNRPDRLSRLFDTEPLTSQNAVVSSSEVSIGNLAFLSKLQRYLTRVFFGGSRYTDVMYSVFGQKVPHVDSPVLLDVFDEEIGSELVASTNATETQNPGVLGGYFSSSGVLSTGRGRSRKRYSFNESGYLIDLVVAMPRLCRSAFLQDFYPVTVSDELPYMSQGNFVPDFNGIGWQQPAFVSKYFTVGGAAYALGNPPAFCCEPSWQQYRTLPDICHGALNPLRGQFSTADNFQPVSASVELNSPLFLFTDRADGSSVKRVGPSGIYGLLPSLQYTDFNDLNRVFGTSYLTYDNIFVVFRYAHQAKRQVSKRFTLSFN